MLVEQLRDYSRVTFSECLEAATMLKRYLALADELEEWCDVREPTELDRGRINALVACVKKIREIAEGGS